MALTCDAYMWCERTRPLHLAVQIHAVRGHVGHPHPSARFVRAGGEAIHRHARQSAGRFAGGVNESFAFFLQFASRSTCRAGSFISRGREGEGGEGREYRVFVGIGYSRKGFFFFFSNCCCGVGAPIKILSYRPHHRSFVCSTRLFFCLGFFIHRRRATYPSPVPLSLILKLTPRRPRPQPWSRHWIRCPRCRHRHRYHRFRRRHRHRRRLRLAGIAPGVPSSPRPVGLVVNCSLFHSLDF